MYMNIIYIKFLYQINIFNFFYQKKILILILRQRKNTKEKYKGKIQRKHTNETHFFRKVDRITTSAIVLKPNLNTFLVSSVLV